MRRHGLAISSNKHHTHTHTHTYTSSQETRGNQRVVLPPAKPPSLLLTAPPRSPTNPYPNHPATSPPPPCWMPAAVCLKEAHCARRKTHSCTAEPSSNVYIVTLGPDCLPGPASARGPRTVKRGGKKEPPAWEALQPGFSKEPYHRKAADESLKKPQASNVTGIGKEGVAKRGGWGILKTRVWKSRERERARARSFIG